MRVIVAKDTDAMAAAAAEIYQEVLGAKPSCVLGLATGSTPVRTYQELIKLFNEGKLDFSRVTTFNLDEYYPLEPSHDQSYRYFMNHNLFDHICDGPRGLRKDRTHVPDGTAEDVEQSCWLYEQSIRRAGGIDLQILGIGSNGHIAFNEPGSSLASRTRLVVLTKSTIADNSRFFASPDDVPKYAISMGIGTILEARRIILMANGDGKADAIAKSIEGPITAQVPASALQLHPNVTWIVDEAAGSKLDPERRDYYAHANDLLRKHAAS